MLAYKLSKYGLSNLKLKTIKDLQLRPGEVLVEQYATSINSADIDMIKGNLFGRFSGPIRPKYKIPGSDLAGIIIKVSSEVKKFKVGDRVYGDMSEEGFATFASHKAVKESALTKIPEGMSFVTAASIASAGVIALQAVEKKSLGSNSNVCINGVGGGMGTIGLQIAKYYGSHVVGVDTKYKEEKMYSFGVDEFVNFQSEDYTKLKNQYDLIIDCQCLHPIKTYLSMLKDKGVYTMVGGSIFKIIQAALWGKKTTKGTDKSIGVLLGEMNNLTRMEKLNKLWSDNCFESVIDTIYDFQDFPQALEHFVSGRFVGKIVIEITKEENSDRQ